VTAALNERPSPARASSEREQRGMQQHSREVAEGCFGCARHHHRGLVRLDLRLQQTEDVECGSAYGGSELLLCGRRRILEGRSGNERARASVVAVSSLERGVQADGLEVEHRCRAAVATSGCVARQSRGRSRCGATL
jgi:hypothetical protein